MCGCTQTRKPPAAKPKSLLSSSGNFTQQSVLENTGQGGQNQMVTVEYIGPMAETFTIRSRTVPGISYRFGNNDLHRIKSVFLGDAEYLIGQLGRDAKPTYRVVGVSGAEEVYDPVTFIGAPITAP